MSAAKPKRTVYDDPTDAELARWPGVTWARQVRGKHYALILTFNGVSRFVTYPGTPGDSTRGVLNHLADVRAALRYLGATRTPEPRAASPRRARNRTDAPVRITERATGGPKRDPWEALRTLEVVEPTPVQPPAPEPVAQPKLSLWAHITRWFVMLTGDRP